MSVDDKRIKAIYFLPVQANSWNYDKEDERKSTVYNYSINWMLSYNIKEFSFYEWKHSVQVLASFNYLKVT